MHYVPTCSTYKRGRRTFKVPFSKKGIQIKKSAANFQLIPSKGTAPIISEVFNDPAPSETKFLTKNLIPHSAARPRTKNAPGIFKISRKPISPTTKLQMKNLTPHFRPNFLYGITSQRPKRSGTASPRKRSRSEKPYAAFPPKLFIEIRLGRVRGFGKPSFPPKTAPRGGGNLYRPLSPGIYYPPARSPVTRRYNTSRPMMSDRHEICSRGSSPRVSTCSLN